MKKLVLLVVMSLLVIPATVTSTSATVKVAAAVEPAVGCEKGLPTAADYTVDLDRAPIRCEPGKPAAVPLKTKTTIKVGVPSAGFLELSSVIPMGMEKGEFAKENLEIETVPVTTVTAMQLLAQGSLDFYSSWDTSFFNLLGSGFKMTIPLSAFQTAPESRDGVWIRTDKVKNVKDLKGKTVATLAGFGTPAFYGMYSLMKKNGLKTTDITISRLDTANAPIALKNGAVDAALVNAPVWSQLGFDKDPTFKFLVGLFPPGEPGGGVAFGSRIQSSSMNEVRQAFIRAYVRTLSTYFRAGYKKNPQIVADLARIVKQPESTIASTPEIIFDYVYRDHTLEKTQDMFREAAVLNYPKNFKEKSILARDDLIKALSKPKTTTKK